MIDGMEYVISCCLYKFPSLIEFCVLLDQDSSLPKTFQVLLCGNTKQASLQTLQSPGQTAC